MRYTRIVAAACVALALFTADAFAKRVIWVGNNKESEDAGQFYALNPQPGDVIQREAAGTTLAQARGKIANGDTFIIITHGSPGSLVVGGSSVDGFGTGTGAGCGAGINFPPITETNVTVILHVCHSDDDPDGAGPQKSVTESLTAIVTGAGSTVTGKAGTVSFTCSFSFSNPAAPTPAQLANLSQCKADAAAAAGFAGPSRINDWVNSFGGAAKQAAVSAAITACRTAGIDLPDQTYEYTQPQAPGGFAPRYTAYEGVEVILPNGIGVIPEDPIVVIQPCGPPGCQGPVIVPTTSEWGLIIMAVAFLLGGGFILRRSII